MNDTDSYIVEKQPVRGRRSLLVIGIILMCISLFLASFVLSYSLIINPVGQINSELETLTEENAKLQSDAQLLQDQLDVVQSELDTYKDKYGSLSSSSSTTRTSSSSSSSSSSNSRYYDDDDDED